MTRINRNIQSTRYELYAAYLQAAEKYRPTRRLLQHRRHASNIFDTSLPRIIFRYCSQKTKQRQSIRPPRQFNRHLDRILKAFRTQLRKVRRYFELLPFARHDDDLKDSTIVDSQPVLFCVRCSPELPTSCATSMSRRRLSTNKPSLQARIILRNIHSPSVTEPNASSSNCECRLGDIPITPVEQMIQTPLYPPPIEKCDPKKTPIRIRSCIGRETNFSDRLDFSRFDSPIIYDFGVRQVKELAHRRILTRCQSYPHTSSTPPTLTPPCHNVHAQGNDGQGLASPFILPSSLSAGSDDPCTPICDHSVKFRDRLQPSPHYLGYFA